MRPEPSGTLLEALTTTDSTTPPDHSRQITQATDDTGSNSVTDEANLAFRARQYCQYVNKHAGRGQDQCLFCGPHYRGLSHLLSAKPPTVAPRPSPPFALVVVKDFEPLQPPSSVTVFEPEETEKLMTWAITSRSSARIVFIRGYITPKWIALLGALHRIDTEFFRQNLSFVEDKEFFDLPPCPSNSANILRVRIPSIFKRHTTLSKFELMELRRDETKSARRYLRSINRDGMSMVRRFSFHDETTFTIEQDVSILISNRNKRGWQALVWLDAGRDLSHEQDAPWQGSSKKWHDHRNDAVPNIRHVSAKILASLSAVQQAHARRKDDSQPQSVSHLPQQYGQTLDSEVAAPDALYAVSEIIFFYTTSETQFLNLLENKLTEIMEQSHTRETFALEDLHYHSRLLADHAQHIEEVRSFIEARATLCWALPRDRHQEAVRTQTLLTEDLAYLARRCSRISSQTAAAMNYISNSVMLEESHMAIAKADRMHRLTLLAFFVLPLSFTTSLFGCNFTSFGTGTVPLWAFFVTLIPVTLIALCLCYWEAICRIEWNFKKTK